MSMNMRHWAIAGIAGVTIAAMFTDTPLEQLSVVIGGFVAIIAGDKAISMRT